MATVQDRGTRLPGFASAAGDASSDEWHTPPAILAPVRAALGGRIDLDPASCAAAAGRVGAGRWYGLPDDGLALPWFGAVFVNPPYSRAAAWLRRALKAVNGGEVAALAVLTHATSMLGTDSGLALVERAAAVALPGRVRFVRPDGSPGDSSPRDASVLVLAGKVDPVPLTAAGWPVLQVRS